MNCNVKREPASSKATSYKLPLYMIAVVDAYKPYEQGNVRRGKVPGQKRAGYKLHPIIVTPPAIDNGCNGGDVI